MQPDSEKPKKAGRKHVTTACVPCRESKIRVCCLSCFYPLFSFSFSFSSFICSYIFILFCLIFAADTDSVYHTVRRSFPALPQLPKKRKRMQISAWRRQAKVGGRKQSYLLAHTAIGTDHKHMSPEYRSGLLPSFFPPGLTSYLNSFTIMD